MPNPFFYLTQSKGSGASLKLKYHSVSVLLYNKASCMALPKPSVGDFNTNINYMQFYSVKLVLIINFRLLIIFLVY